MSGGAAHHQEPKTPQHQQRWTQPQLAAFFQRRKHLDDAELSRSLNMSIASIQQLQHHFRDLLSKPDLDLATFLSAALHWCSPPCYTLLCRAAAPQWGQLRLLLDASSDISSKQYRQQCCEKIFAITNLTADRRRCNSANKANALLPLQTTPSATTANEVVESFQVGEKVVLWRHDTAEAELGVVAAPKPHQKLSVALCRSGSVVHVDCVDVLPRSSDANAASKPVNGDEKENTPAATAARTQHKHREDCLNEMAEIIRWTDRKATLLAQLKVLNDVCSHSASAASICALLQQDYAWIVLELQRTNDVLDNKLQQCRVLVSSGGKAQGSRVPASMNVAEMLQRCRQDAAQMLTKAAEHQTDVVSPDILQFVQHSVSLVCLLQEIACGSRVPADGVAVALRSLEPHCSANLQLFHSITHTVEQLADLLSSTAAQAQLHMEHSSTGSVQQRLPQ